MSSYDYRHLDVFTTRRLEGNPLAVFPDGRGLDEPTMQRIARELNLSETVFVLPASRDGRCAQLRIFTPRRELAFAGHPTIGAAHTLLSTGLVSGERFIVEEAIGDVPVRVEHDRELGQLLWLTTPPVRFGETVDPDACARALGLARADLDERATPQYVSAGSPFLYVALASPEAVDRVRYDAAQLPRAAWPDVVGTFVFSAAPRRVDGLPAVFSRMFAPESGIPEDPATGGATGPLAAYIIRSGLLQREDTRRFVSEQGAKMGRRSLLHVAVTPDETDDATIEVGGSAVQLGHGTLFL